jgi:eukaryotic-like serine/threonine-protein kinase
MSSKPKEAEVPVGPDPGLALVADRYRVRDDEPIPALDAPGGVKAYNATDERGSPKALFALICRNDLAARTDVLNQFSRFNRLPMTTPVRWGVVNWAPEKARRLAIIMHQPGGERILPRPDATMDPWREDRVIRTVMHPLMPIFKELGGRNLTHRSVRADNLFFADGTRESVVLGECFSGPPAMAQPAIYETIDSAMAMPEGRGYGSPADDFYALGVLILHLLCGGNPVPHLGEEEVIKAKISKGSYAAIVGDTRLSLPMVEALRGLLCDDPEERWTHEDLVLWLNGRHLSPKQALLPPKAARMFPFDGVDYNNAPALSNAMGRHWTEALKLIKDNELERWVRRSLSDDVHADTVKAATQAAAGIGGGGSTLEDRLLSRVLVALDAQAPLRYKQISVRIQGFASAFAANYNNDERRQSFAEMIQYKLPQLWIESQVKARADQVSFARSLDLVGLHLSKPRIGYGLERTLYALAPGWPCQSTLLKNDYVADLESLLPALERLAQQGRTEQVPIDRHIAGYISARMKVAPDRAFSELTQEDNPIVFNIGVVRLLSDVQEAVGPARLPNLGVWCAKLLKPVTVTYRNRERREQMVSALRQLGAKGNLAALLRLADNPDRRLADEQGFRRAKAEYAALVEQMGWLRNGGLTRPAIVRTSAREASSITAAVISAVAVLIITVTSVF